MAVDCDPPITDISINDEILDREVFDRRVRMIRMGLGARPQDVLRRTLAGVALSDIGILVGAAGALAVTRVLSKMLFGVVAAADPAAFLPVVPALAAYVPARRATMVDGAGS